jgi:hypothetical protein
MTEPFQPISGAAVRVLARLAAKKALTSQLRAQGKRQPLPRPSAISAHLAANPQLYEQALARTWELSIRDQRGRINAAIFQDDRRGWRKPHRLPDSESASQPENSTKSLP